VRWAAVAIGLFGAALLIRAQVDPAHDNDSGDASQLYTDHLRHEGEAGILFAHGLDVYRRPYGAQTAIHPDLFPERTAPYPPLAIAVHAPWHPHHRALVWAWCAVALLAAGVVVRLVAPLTVVAEAWALLLAVPLLVGIGINGFSDGGYLLCGALGCLAWRQDRPRAALLWLALACALSFRAVVFAPLALALLPDQRGSTRALAAALVVPTLVAAAALAGTLDTIPAHSPVHLSHLRFPFFAFIGLGAAVAFCLFRGGEPHVALTLLAAVAVGVTERSHGWWHAGALLAPGFVLAARHRTYGWHWPVLVAWTVASSYLAYRHPPSVFWTWVAFAT
jgi:hypothetical protein